MADELAARLQARYDDLTPTDATFFSMPQPGPGSRIAEGSVTGHGGRLAPYPLYEPPRGDNRPHELEDQEADLLLAPRVEGEHDRADEVEDQVRVALAVEPAELGGHEGREDEERPRDLDELMHAII